MKKLTNLTTLSYEQSDFHTNRVVSNGIVSRMFTAPQWITVSLIHWGIKTGKWRLLKKQNKNDFLIISHIYTFIVLYGVMNTVIDGVVFVYMNTGFAIDNYYLDKYFDSLSDVLFRAYALMTFCDCNISIVKPMNIFSKSLLKLQQIYESANLVASF